MRHWKPIFPLKTRKPSAFVVLRRSNRFIEDSALRMIANFVQCVCHGKNLFSSGGKQWR